MGEKNRAEDRMPGKQIASPEGGLTPVQSLLIGLSLIYLAIPNLLFMWGWYMPWAAVAGSICIALYLWSSLRPLVRGSGNSLSLSRGTVVAALLLFVLLGGFFLIRGIVGLWPIHEDSYVFRQALFCNLRDAAWPLILPNGREMSYYIANMLPPAALARMLPVAWNQWAIVFWTVPAMFLSLALFHSILPDGRYGRGVSILLFSMLALCFFDLSFTVSLADFQLAKVMCDAEQVSVALTEMCHAHGLEVDWKSVFHGRGLILNPLFECMGAYNSVPVTLLAAAVIMACAHHSTRVVCLTICLLAASSPIGCIGLMPLAAVQYWRGLAHRGGIMWKAVLPDAALCVLMLFLLAVYFMRADSLVEVCLAGSVYGWLHYDQLRRLICWLLFVLPLVPHERKNPGFWVCAIVVPVLCYVYIGTTDSSLTEGCVNELHVKCVPAYSLILVYFWYRNWARIFWLWRAVLLSSGAFCLMFWGAHSYLRFSSKTYLNVADKWNGHLNHDAPFLNQSVPPCRPPAVPGVLLREPGASEQQLPGSLLPKAPGCDYSRPPAGAR